MSTPRPTGTPNSHPSPSDQMRLRLAEERLRGKQEMDYTQAQLADLILMTDRLGNTVEDLIKLVREAWPDEKTWSSI